MLPITIHWRQSGRTLRREVPEGEYILRSFEQQGEPLPFSCRNGCCTACAVRVIAAQTGKGKEDGYWQFGVTGLKSRRAPRVLPLLPLRQHLRLPLLHSAKRCGTTRVTMHT